MGRTAPDFSPEFLRAVERERKRIERYIDQLDRRIETAQRQFTKDHLAHERLEAVRALQSIRGLR